MLTTTSFILNHSPNFTINQITIAEALRSVFFFIYTIKYAMTRNYFYRNGIQNISFWIDMDVDLEVVTVISEVECNNWCTAAFRSSISFCWRSIRFIKYAGPPSKTKILSYSLQNLPMESIRMNVHQCKIHSWLDRVEIDYRAIAMKCIA